MHVTEASQHKVMSPDVGENVQRVAIEDLSFRIKELALLHQNPLKKGGHMENGLQRVLSFTECLPSTTGDWKATGGLARA